MITEDFDLKRILILKYTYNINLQILKIKFYPFKNVDVFHLLTFSLLREID